MNLGGTQRGIAPSCAGKSTPIYFGNGLAMMTPEGKGNFTPKKLKPWFFFWILGHIRGITCTYWIAVFFRNRFLGPCSWWSQWGPVNFWDLAQAKGQQHVSREAAIRGCRRAGLVSSSRRSGQCGNSTTRIVGLTIQIEHLRWFDWLSRTESREFHDGLESWKNHWFSIIFRKNGFSFIFPHFSFIFPSLSFIVPSLFLHFSLIFPSFFLHFSLQPTQGPQVFPGCVPAQAAWATAPWNPLLGYRAWVKDLCHGSPGYSKSVFKKIWFQYPIISHYFFLISHYKRISRYR